MAIRKLWEPFGIRYLRSQVKDSLQYHGEEAVLLQLYHAKDEALGINRCPRCHWDVYQDGENMCPVCFGTSFFNDQTQTGGVRAAYRVWCLFTDHVVSEQYLKQGVMTPDQRTVQCQPFPLLMEHDIIARVRRWDPVTHTALSEPDFFSVDAVTRNSLRTGSRFGQTADDVVGQTAQCSWLPPNSNGIQLYPIQNVVFDEAPDNDGMP